MKKILTFFRLIRTGFILSRYDALIPKEYAKNVPWILRFIGWVSRIFAIRGRAKNPGERFAKALEKLGPAYIKFGQILSTRTDLIDAEFSRGLARLKDNVPPFSQDLAIKRVEKEYGKKITEVFSEFSQPIAAASVAQVHKARFINGEIVAVKILRPDIRKSMQNDMDVLFMLAGFVEKFSRFADRLQPKLFMKTVARAVILELDLRLEAAAASELSEAAEETGLFLVPEIFWDYSSKNIMVMEWVDGTLFSDEKILSDKNINRPELAVKIIQTFLACAFDYGVFHADMHEGNLVVNKDGQLVLLDFGILGRLGTIERRFHAEILYGFLQRDYHRIAEIHFEAGYVPKNHSIADFASALRAVGEPIFGKTSDKVSMAKVLGQLFEITEIFDMQMQPQLIMLQKTMMQAEGVARRLDPEFDMWEASRPIVEASLKRELGAEGKLSDFIYDLRQAQKTLRSMPDIAENIALMAEAWVKGELVKGEKTKDDKSYNFIDKNSVPKTMTAKTGVFWAVAGAGLALIGVWVAGLL